MTDPGRWLDARRPQAPASLRAAIDRALARTPPEDGPLEERLARAALAALRGVVREDGGRESAEALLAADALLTYACEAAAERGHEALGSLTAGLGPERFGALLPGGGS